MVHGSAGELRSPQVLLSVENVRAHQPPAMLWGRPEVASVCPASCPSRGQTSGMCVRLTGTQGVAKGAENFPLRSVCLCSASPMGFRPFSHRSPSPGLEGNGSG